MRSDSPRRLMPERRPTVRQKRAVAERAGGRCEYCLSPAGYAPSPFSVEHIEPRVGGGSRDLSNLALACQGCNNLKYTHTEATDPLTGEMAPLYHPRLHRWRDHFSWGEDLIEMVGLTPTGRATIKELQLNRRNVCNLRRVLLFFGEHPPAGTGEG